MKKPRPLDYTTRCSFISPTNLHASQVCEDESTVPLDTVWELVVVDVVLGHTHVGYDLTQLPGIQLEDSNKHRSTQYMDNAN